MRIFLKISSFIIIMIIFAYSVFFLIDDVQRYFYAKDLQADLSMGNVAEVLEDVSATNECNSIEEHDLWVFIDFDPMDYYPYHFYSWRISFGGKKREGLYFKALCNVSILRGRTLTTEEVENIALHFVYPKVELLVSLERHFWLWILVTLSTFSLFNSGRKENSTAV